MIQRLGAVASAWAARAVPSPFVFAILLTVIAALAAVALTEANPWQVVGSWQRGFWELLTFAMQMCLILVTGHALASTGAVRGALARLASIPRTTGDAAALTSLVAMLAALLNWGFGLIVGAFLAREVGRAGRDRGLELHYPLIVAAGYTGLLIWHGGYSGSAPLAVATEGHFLAAEIGVIPVSRTLLSPLNLIVTALLLVLVPLVLRAMAPSRATVLYDPRLHGGEHGTAQNAAKTVSSPTPAERVDQSRVLGMGTALLGLVWVAHHFATRGLAGLDLNTMNWTFLFLGLLLHGRPLAYVRAIDEAVRGVGGIILQFPFYAGIMGIMKYTGLVGVLSAWFVTGARELAEVGVPAEATFSTAAFLSAGLVNLFVPSGGGQWAVQGPILVDAARELGVSVEKTVMALSYGDEWTNMLQPFWALPLLAITGLKGRDMIGYTAALMLLVVVPVLIALAVA